MLAEAITRNSAWSKLVGGSVESCAPITRDFTAGFPVVGCSIGRRDGFTIESYTYLVLLIGEYMDINDLRTPNGGFTRRTLAALGVGWPPKKDGSKKCKKLASI